jgi:hypothetical protein
MSAHGVWAIFCAQKRSEHSLNKKETTQAKKKQARLCERDGKESLRLFERNFLPELGVYFFFFRFKWARIESGRKNYRAPLFNVRERKKLLSDSSGKKEEIKRRQFFSNKIFRLLHTKFKRVLYRFFTPIPKVGD